MKSVLFSRFFILLPWILIVILMLDVDTRRPAPPLTPRPYFSPYAVGRGGARHPFRRGGPDVGPGRGWEKRNESRPQPRPRPEPPLPTIYAITPTYSRPVQKAELTRLANTFRQVAQLHWILVEDAAARSELVSRFLARAGLPSTHLHVPTPRRYKRPGLPRATEQRNAGLAWLRQRHQHQRAQSGVLFFADDDNTYSLELFQEVAAGPPQLGGWGGGRAGGASGPARLRLHLGVLSFPYSHSRLQVERFSRAACSFRWSWRVYAGLEGGEWTKGLLWLKGGRVARGFTVHLVLRLSRGSSTGEARGFPGTRLWLT